MTNDPPIIFRPTMNNGYVVTTPDGRAMFVSLRKMIRLAWQCGRDGRKIEVRND